MSMSPRLLLAASLGLSCFLQQLLPAGAAASLRHGFGNSVVADRGARSTRVALAKGRKDVSDTRAGAAGASGDGSSSTGDVADATNASMNFCMGGQLAPQFFLLGTTQSGTSHFIEAFVRSPGVVTYKLGEPDGLTTAPWVFQRNWSENATQVWLSHYPACSHERRLVAVDCTPGYFGNFVAPYSLKQAYGDFKPLVFMVFLREPLARAQAHYYQFKEDGVLQGRIPNCPASKFPPTFAAAVKRFTNKGTLCNCDCDYIFMHSMYVGSFQRYFVLFKAERFHVVPFNDAANHDVVKYAWDLLHLPHGGGPPSDLVGKVGPLDDHDYPAVKEDLPRNLHFHFKTFMLDRAGASNVAKVLAPSPAKLYGYTDPERTIGKVSMWLDKGWGS